MVKSQTVERQTKGDVKILKIGKIELSWSLKCSDVNITKTTF